MKKLIASLMSLTIAGTAAATVVACGVKASTVEMVFSEGNAFRIKDEDAISKTMKELLKEPTDATINKYSLQSANGGAYNWSAGFIPYSTLMAETLQILNYNLAGMSSKTEQVENVRTTFRGNEAVSETKINTISVDGNYLNEEIDGTQVDFYNKYQSTTINSFKGLYDLYTFAQENKDAKIESAGAKASLDMINATMADNADAQAFFESYLSLTKKGEATNSVFKSAELTPGDITTTSSQSSVFEANKDKAQAEGMSFKDANKGIKDPTDEEEKKAPMHTSNDKFNPYTLKTIKQDNEISAGVIDQIQLEWVDAPEAEKAKDPAFATNDWETIVFDGDASKLKIQAAAFEKEIKEKDKPTRTETRTIFNTRKSVISSITTDATMKYVYNTDLDADSGTTDYEITFKLEGLQAVYYPRVSTVTLEKEDGKKVNQLQINWVFRGYQFNDEVDTMWMSPKDRDEEKNNSKFKNFKISDLEIKKA
ncbi:hypothetical protein [[Acholeplasma] multilocale]|uniref:hypothetical protein n=1 Tax=[Acholeplasma] multilocale TaxID=264638 RepID=UPI00047C7885|nr:hypothetical protein [[Acholeplasma] multilocale]